LRVQSFGFANDEGNRFPRHRPNVRRHRARSPARAASAKTAEDLDFWFRGEGEGRKEEESSGY
jgi:hypothetical protein